MDIEKVFMSCYKIKEQPDDIFNLIKLALRVGAFEYKSQFEKRKARIIKFLMNPSITSTDEEEKDDDEEEEEEEVIQDNVGDQDDVTSIEEPEKEEVIDGVGIQQQITVQSNKPLIKKNRVVIKKTVQVAPVKKQNNCNAITTLTESGTELKNQLQKQSHKGFKKMESDTEKKREEGAQQTPTQCRRKECTTGSTKSMNVLVAPPPHPKKSNRSSSIRPMQKASQSSAVARPMKKETQSDTDMKKKFESSKRKFEERLAEQREAKRRTVMVDFHQMPKPANGPRAPKRCWNRKRF